MNTEIEIHVRVFPVVVKDMRSGEVIKDVICLDKARLQAAQIIGQSSKELIWRAYNKEGYKVLDIGAALKKTVTVDLEELCFDAGGGTH